MTPWPSPNVVPTPRPVSFLTAAVALVIAAGGGAVVYATGNTASSSSAIGQAPAGMGQPPNGGSAGGGDVFGSVTPNSFASNAVAGEDSPVARR